MLMLGIMLSVPVVMGLVIFFAVTGGTPNPKLFKDDDEEETIPVP